MNCWIRWGVDKREKGRPPMRVIAHVPSRRVALWRVAEWQVPTARGLLGVAFDDLAELRQHRSDELAGLAAHRGVELLHTLRSAVDV